MTGSVVTAASVSQNPITVTIDGGADATGASPDHTFLPNSAHVSGGSRNYTYAWAIIGDGLGAWSFTGQGTSAASPVVRSAVASQRSYATLSCTVTDTRTHQSVTSPGVSYSYLNIGRIGGF